MTSKHGRVSPQARQDATEWFVRLREDEPDTNTREAFDSWLRRSPDNVHAYLRVIALWEDTELLARSDLFDRDQLLARARAEPTNVVPLDTHSNDNAAVTAAVRGNRRTRFLAVAASFLLAVGAALLLYAKYQAGVYGTDVGEQRTLTLADGSTIVLNAKSRVRTRLGEKQRDIDLLEGQAIFRVARDAARPFIVHAGNTNVTALGTQFDVYKKPTLTTVTVIEGRVSVAGAGQGSADISNPAQASSRDPISESNVLRPIYLTAGEQVAVPAMTSADTSVPPTPTRTDPAAVTAWTQGKLVFNETPLTDVIAEFNRYSTRRLLISDPDILNFHITGTFPTGDPIRIAELLQARFGAKIEQSDDEIRIVRP